MAIEPDSGKPDRIHIEAKKPNWLPWLLLGLGVLALLFFLSRCNREAAPVATTTTTTATTTVPAAAPAAAVAATDGASVGQLGAFLGGTEAAPRTFVFDNLNFDTSKADIRPADRATVTEVANVLKQYAATRVRIAGYADARGSDPANMELGKRRAEAVKAALVADGIAADRIETVSGGDREPIATNATAAGQAENRRTELVVLSR